MGQFVHARRTAHRSLLMMILLVACAGCPRTSENGGGSVTDAEARDSSTADTAPRGDGVDSATHMETDTGPDADSGLNCDSTWETADGTARCCADASLSCESFAFESSGSNVSSFDPSTDEWTVRYDPTDVELVAATARASKMGSNTGSSFTQEGSIAEAGRIVFDFSGQNFGPDEQLRLDRLVLEDACGTEKTLSIGTTVDPNGSSEQTGFDCSEGGGF